MKTNKDTTIILLSALRNWFHGKSQPERMTRQNTALEANWQLANAVTEQPDPQTIDLALKLNFDEFDPFHTYRARVMPGLKKRGYRFFFKCNPDDYVDQQEWCNTHAEDDSLAHCGLWSKQPHPRAFKSESDAILFRINFNTEYIPLGTDSEGGETD
ncbi:hypothetical protein [Roseateles albus]|uniref:Uncharacterized protein n=1 Tax=Roseateles albus TaxID=2987525 RepID=A0ABT5KL61_9BURK|nr:hypothetical protein [Roseateles albus]MDC8773566.1 hypothetical protein [Roseateles albus]